MAKLNEKHQLAIASAFAAVIALSAVGIVVVDGPKHHEVVTAAIQDAGGVGKLHDIMITRDDGKPLAPGEIGSVEVGQPYERTFGEVELVTPGCAVVQVTTRSTPPVTIEGIPMPGFVYVRVRVQNNTDVALTCLGFVNSSSPGDAGVDAGP